MPIKVALTPDAVEAFREYVRIKDEIETLGEQGDKARAHLVGFLGAHGAEEGTIDDSPVIRLLRRERRTLDTSRLKEEEPFLYRRFERVTPYESLYILGRK